MKDPSPTTGCICEIPMTPTKGSHVQGVGWDPEKETVHIGFKPEPTCPMHGIEAAKAKYPFAATGALCYMPCWWYLIKNGV